MFKNTKSRAKVQFTPIPVKSGSRCKTLIQGPTTGAPSKSRGGPSLGSKPILSSRIQSTLVPNLVRIRRSLQKQSDIQDQPIRALEQQRLHLINQSRSFTGIVRYISKICATLEYQSRSLSDVLVPYGRQ